MPHDRNHTTHNKKDWRRRVGGKAHLGFNSSIVSHTYYICMAFIWPLVQYILRHWIVIKCISSLHSRRKRHSCVCNILSGFLNGRNSLFRLVFFWREEYGGQVERMMWAWWAWWAWSARLNRPYHESLLF